MTLQESVEIFATCFGLAALAGIAYLLSSNKKLTWRSAISAILYNGVSGLTCSLLCWQIVGKDHLELLIGLSILSGVGGTSAMDFIWQFITGKMSVTVSINKSNKSDDKKGS